MYILEATPNGFPILSCTIMHDVDLVKKDSMIYYSAKLQRGDTDETLYMAMFPGDTQSLNLSSREQEVLNYIYQGYTSKEIAEFLNVSFDTVKKHRSNILSKTGASNSAELINKAKLMGVL